MHDVNYPPYHVDRSETQNWLRVFWDGDGEYPGSDVTNGCAANHCEELDDGSCLCEIEVVESIVFYDITTVSKEDILSQLFVGARGPPGGSVATGADAYTAHIVGDTIDETTVFEVNHQGMLLYLRNVRSTVSVGVGNAQIFQAEEATVTDAVSSIW